ncbi:response regulator [Dongshaea marina]|uniref:response regulator n=1 Tax=Dongshaea marina TaxID=2047966 RepID=UPI000D3E3C12|nr:response regulator [Dongshaea marina]
MKKYLIVCVDDEREVLDSIEDDLSEFAERFEIESTESVAEAREVIDEMAGEGVKLALILCDHIMPGTLGVDFLIELNERPQTCECRRVLLTGQADQEATIEAINHGGLHYFVGKPWLADELRKVVIEQLTEFVIQHESEELMSYAKLLDSEKVFAAMQQKRMDL